MTKAAVKTAEDAGGSEVGGETAAAGASGQTGRPVLVTTEFRGVFFGYVEDTTGDMIDLKGARNCIHWPSKTGGFMGLAETGPAKGSRIGARADIQLRKITSVAEVTAEAASAWEAAETYRG